MKRTTLILTSKAFALAAVLLSAATANGQPSFSKSFSPSTIGAGSVSRLTFTINESSGRPVTSLAFTDVLPAAVTIATPANLEIGGNCRDVAVSAPDGGTTITLSDGAVGGGSTCTIAVDVTSSTPGTHSNVSGDLTSSSGNSGSATADLTVSNDAPGFSKSFSPSSVPFGGRSTLTFTIDNSAGTQQAFNLRFTDNLPNGMVVADPANAATDCVSSTVVPALTAVPGTSEITLAPSFSGQTVVAAGATCTVSVDVTAQSVGELVNVSGELTSQFFTVISSGTASATLTVTPLSNLILSKEFTDDPIVPGDTGTLEFTILNRSRSDAATGVTFADDLDATLTGLVAVGLPASNVCGAGSTLSGTSLITLTGATIPAEGSCTFSATVSVPAGATPGSYPNTTTSITGSLGGRDVTGDPAADSLVVAAAPRLSKSFDPSAVAPGDAVTLEYTVTNPSTTSSATNIQFDDRLGRDLGFEPSLGTQFDVCGSGSTASPSFSFGTLQYSLFGGTLAPGASCTFDVTFNVPLDAPTNAYVSTSEPVRGTVDGTELVGNSASDTLTVVAGPRLSKSFNPGTVAPGDTVTIEFRLSHNENSPTAATDVTFTDDLTAALTGMTASLPASPNPPCGAGSTLTGSAGDTLLTLAGGTLAPGEECTFSVEANVPAGAAGGAYTNVTSMVSSTVGGASVGSPAASATLSLAGLSFSKEFIGEPVVAGEELTLRFTLENTNPAEDVTAISFTDDLRAMIPGATDVTVAGALPTAPCGAGSTLIEAFSGFLVLTGGQLTAGAPECSFDVTLLVPPSTPDGSYVNQTGSVTATVGGVPMAFGSMSDNLTVASDVLLLTKEFTDDPVAAGSTATMRFTISNSDATRAISDVEFTDDLDAVLSGLTAIGVENDSCGFTPGGLNTGTLSLSNGSVAAGGSCVVDVNLAVPSGASGGPFTNTTSSVSGMIGGLAVTGLAATDQLQVSAVRFTKSFVGPATAGETVTLSYRIENLGAQPLSGLAFNDDFDGALSGLTAAGPLTAEPCGVGSALSGTSVLAMTGGNVAAMGSCSFDVTLLAPEGAPVAVFTSTSTGLRAGGAPAADPASANLTVLNAVTNGASASADGATTVNAATTDLISP